LSEAFSISNGMKATAKLRHLRMAPRKVRMSADLIRGKGVEEAQRLLLFAAKHSALPVLKTLNSAVASAKNNFNAVESNLYISHIAVNEGPKLKRFRARARGMAYEIQKKTSHIIIEVNELKEGKEVVKKETPKVVQAPQRTAPRTAAVKPKFKMDKEIAQTKEKRGGIQRMFRRKSI